MKIGIGLPVDDPDVLREWAVRADTGPFSTLGLLDRLVWHNPEPLVTLAVLAGVTSRIRLQTEVLLAPLRGTALLAKQVATLDRLCRGRFTLGLGVGGRADDHAAAGVDLRDRGRRFDEQLTRMRMRELWGGGSAIGPAFASPGGPEALFGAFRPAALARVARFGDGLLCAAPPSWAGELFRQVERDWAEHTRPGRPRFVGQVNVAPGRDDVVDAARTAMRAYYGFTGNADHMSGGLLTVPGRVRDAVRAYADLGADEVVLYCWSTDVAQVDRMADLVS